MSLITVLEGYTELYLDKGWRRRCGTKRVFYTNSRVSVKTVIEGYTDEFLTKNMLNDLTESECSI